MGDGDHFPFKSLGDGDPFPLLIKANLKVAGKWELGRAKYIALQIGPFVELVATGSTQFNVQVRLVAAPITIFPPQFGLFFFTPEITLPAEKPFSISTSFASKDAINKVVVWDADGKHDVVVFHAPK
jgi:hypothetical protein